jgi:TolA-binding protein
VLDAEGKERYRIEGYLPREEFFAQVKLGLARVAFLGKRFEEAEAIYNEIIQHHPNSASAAEAIYWRGVAQYKRTKDHMVLNAVAKEFAQHFQGSIWAEKASIWSS